MPDQNTEPRFSDPIDDDAYPALGRLTVLAESFLMSQGGGNLTLICPQKDSGQEGWVASLIYGREAPDSDMVGAHAIGTGENAADALREALAQAGQNV